MTSEMLIVKDAVETRIRYLENALINKTPERLSDVWERQAELRSLKNVLSVINGTERK